METSETPSSHRVLRRLLTAAGIFLGLIVLVAVAVPAFFDVNRYKPQIEAAVSKSLGMDFRMNGKASLRLFPTAKIVLRDIHLINRKSEVFSAEEVDVAPSLMPFLRHRRIEVAHIGLLRPKVAIEKDAHGRMSYETASKKGGGAPAPSAKAGQKGIGPGKIGTVALEDGDISYIDHGTGQRVHLAGVNLRLSGVTWRELQPTSVSFLGSFDAKSLTAGAIQASHLKAELHYESGLLKLAPTEVAVFGGLVKGSLTADLRQPAPKIQITQTASNIVMEQALPAQKDKVSGTVNGSASLAAEGKGPDALTQSLNGTVALNSRTLTLKGVDLDSLGGKLKSGNPADLLKLGSILAKGGAGGGQSVIKDFVSNWTIVKGVAETKDVALSTAKTTVAFKGQVNLVKKTYQAFYIALVDQNGCSKFKQEIAGTLTHPHPVIGSLGSNVGSAGEHLAESAISSALGGAKSIVPGVPAAAVQGCDKFYSGSATQTG